MWIFRISLTHGGEFSHTNKQIYGQRLVKERVNKPVDSVHIEDRGHAGREGVASKATPPVQHAVVEGETILQGRRTIDGLRCGWPLAIDVEGD